jgi:hypothetical protein
MLRDSADEKTLQRYEFRIERLGFHFEWFLWIQLIMKIIATFVSAHFINRFTYFWAPLYI